MDSLPLILLSVAAGALAGLLGGLLAPAVKERGVRLLRARRKRGKRYIIFEVLSAERFSREDVAKAMRDAMLRLYGEVGLAASGLKMIDYDEGRRRGIARVRKEEKWRALAALNYVKEIGGKRARIMPLATSGTLRRAKEIMSS